MYFIHIYYFIDFCFTCETAIPGSKQTFIKRLRRLIKRFLFDLTRKLNRFICKY